MLTDVLKDNASRAPSFGTNSLLVIPGHPEVAAKTGTSNNLRDNLAIGYTQDFVVAVWVGNNDNSPMTRIASGLTGATPIFHKIMRFLLSDMPSKEWLPPSGLAKLPICPYTGTLSCNGCPTRMEWFLEEKRPEKACDPSWFEKKEEEKSKENKISQDLKIISLPKGKKQKLTKEGKNTN